MRIVPLAMCLLSLASVARAQESLLDHAGLPRGVETRLRAIIQNPQTRQLQGAATIADTAPGDVVIYKGPVTVSGKVAGQLIVVDGTVAFEQGSEVAGDVTVVNGEATGLENAAIGGTVMMYGLGLGVFHNDRVLAVNHERRRVYRDDDRRDWGRSSFTVRSSWNYNRVEGLPIQFGPFIETSGRNPTRLEANAIWRTEAGGLFESEHWGYKVRLEQFMGGKHDLRVGASLQNEVEPIESWQLTTPEASLATFLLHEDYRDYFQREGWSAYVRYAPRATGFSATLAYNDEDHSSEPARTPWTLFGDGAWRLQPLVAEGRLRSATASLQYDGRNDDDFPSAGWFVRTDVTRGLGGSLEVPAAYNPLSATAVAPVAVPFEAQFTSGFLDARVYRRVNTSGVLSLRAVAGGALGNESLPPQFQRALGGAATLPGYALFSADCGARRVPFVRADATGQHFFPYYGCDRTAVVSAEYRGGFDLHIGGFGWWEDSDGDHDWNVDSHPSWIVFFDAGRGWVNDSAKSRGALDTRQLYDAGAGILIGDFGIYGAVPLTGSDRGVKFFIRLGPRF